MTSVIWFQYFTSVPCWTSAVNQIEFNRNQVGMTGQGMDLDTHGQAGQYFEQTFYLTEGGVYLFKMDYTGNQDNKLPQTSSFSVLFNGEQIADVTPVDLNKHELKIRVNAKAGQNVLRLTNKSTTPNYGAYVDNVGIYKLNV